MIENTFSEEILKLEKCISERKDTDVPLTNYWKSTFLLSWATLGIHPIKLYFKLIKRVNSFIKRRTVYYGTLIDITEKYAKESGKYDELQSAINEIKESTKKNFTDKITPIWGMRVFTNILGLMINHYQINKVWYDLQLYEKDFYDELSRLWIRLDLIKYPITFKVDMSKHRSFASSLIRCCVGYGIAWNYKIHTDPDSMYPAFHAAEDAVLQTLKQSTLLKGASA